MKNNAQANIESKEETPEWYSAKCIFRHDNLTGKKDKIVYEERVVLLHAHNFDEAIELAEQEAEEYAQSLDGVKYMGFISVYHLFANRMRHKAEVYSIMRKSKLSKKQFLDRYYDDGIERARKRNNAAITHQHAAEQETMSSRVSLGVFLCLRGFDF